jgi:hypothetical protein
MKLLALALMLNVAASLTGVSSTASLAQTPPGPAPGSPGASPPMMQGMPPEMMQMMQRMHSGAMSRMALMGGPFAMMPGATPSNIEGHIAFLKAELKITEPQQKAWDGLADALRTNAKSLAATNPMMGAMNPKLSAVARLEQQEKQLTMQLEALKRSRVALEALSAVLADEQKKRLDDLI